MIFKVKMHKHAFAAEAKPYKSTGKLLALDRYPSWVNGGPILWALKSGPTEVKSKPLVKVLLQACFNCSIIIPTFPINRRINIDKVWLKTWKVSHRVHNTGLVMPAVSQYTEVVINLKTGSWMALTNAATDISSEHSIGWLNPRAEKSIAWANPRLKFVATNFKC